MTVTERLKNVVPDFLKPSTYTAARDSAIERATRVALENVSLRKELETAKANLTGLEQEYSEMYDAADRVHKRLNELNRLKDVHKTNANVMAEVISHQRGIIPHVPCTHITSNKIILSPQSFKVVQGKIHVTCKRLVEDEKKEISTKTVTYPLAELTPVVL